MNITIRGILLLYASTGLATLTWAGIENMSTPTKTATAEEVQIAHDARVYLRLQDIAAQSRDTDSALSALAQLVCNKDSQKEKENDYCKKLREENILK